MDVIDGLLGTVLGLAQPVLDLVSELLGGGLLGGLL